MPISNSWVISIVFWCLAGLLLLVSLIYSHRRSLSPKLREIVPTKIRWLRWILILVTIILIASGLIYVISSQVSTTSSIPTPTPTATPIGGLQLSHPSPQEIYNNISQEPVSLQDDARQIYVGFSVIWAVSLFNMTSSSDGGIIWCTSVDNPLDLVDFTINISNYPQLQSLHRGQGEFIVQGTIEKVDPLYIELNNCSLVFP